MGARSAWRKKHAPTALTPEGIEDHFLRLKNLVEYEEEEEAETFRERFLERSFEEREQAGLLLQNLSAHDWAYSPAGHFLLILTRADRSALPFYTFDEGDVVVLSADAPEISSYPSGTVYDREENSITVAFHKPVPDWSRDHLLTLSKSADRGTYRKLYEAIDEVRSARHGRVAYFRSLSFGLKTPQTRDRHISEFFDKGLNAPQQKAVVLAVQAADIALIHGPPGTGKTRALVEVIRQAVSAGERVFASAPSNVACDNLLERLADAGIPVLRLGHPARILRHLRDHCLDHQLVLHPFTKLVEAVEKEIDQLYKERLRARQKSRWHREDEEEFRRDVSRLKTEKRSISDQLFRQVMGNAKVVVGTHVSGASEILGEQIFDLAVLDEASQATEPLSWISILRAKRLVLAGDHWQLPPTVRSPRAERGGLAVSIFERFMEVLPEEAKVLLTVQYRMHKFIMGFSSAQFYENRLTADQSVENHTLADMPGIAKSVSTEEVFVFIDTAGSGFEEMLEPGSQSRFNPKEAELVLAELKKIRDAGIQPEQVALISPYSAQVRYLESKQSDKRIEVDSVDGFQGREKEAVIVSLVRSNLEGELGFLVDKRRMNVALTRARRKLVVIGDSATLSSIPFYRDFFRYAESIGGYRSAWEYGTGS